MRGLHWLTGLILICACSGNDEDKARSREEFCADWANAACTAETVSACQAANAEACHLSQQAFCISLVPENFSDTRGDECIKAVGAAYKDADLTGAELATVLELGAPCDAILRGPRGVGEECSSTRDCDASKGYECVFHAGSSMGTCQVPELVGPGQKCAALQQTCGAGFYCDGKNCIAVKEAGESCSSSYECGELAICNNDSSCAAKLGVGESCSTGAECASGVCYEVAGEKSCADRIRLSPAESLCENLR
jgi:hypothetical protein